MWNGRGSGRSTLRARRGGAAENAILKAQVTGSNALLDEGAPSFLKQQCGQARTIALVFLLHC